MATRLLAPLCVAIAPLILYDIVSPAKETDEAIITGKTTYYNRGKNICNLEAKGRYTYREEVSRRVYATAEVGDTLRVSLSPIFKEWKTMEVVRSGKTLISARGSDLYWMGAIGLLFLVSFAAYLPDRILFSNLILVITLPVVNFAAVLLWLRFVQLWTGQIEKM
ncbi:MAG: hypothetical protein AB7T27_07545 [Kiritimatiellia bacterium]